jgi:hypothetical protein
MDEVKKIQADIYVYEKELKSLEDVKKCSDVGPVAAKYIDKHISWLQDHIKSLSIKIDMLERD